MAPFLNEIIKSTPSIPYIIGMSLMGSVILLLCVIIIYCYCFNRPNNHQNQAHIEMKSYNFDSTYKNASTSPIEIDEVKSERLNMPLPPVESLEQMMNSSVVMRSTTTQLNTFNSKKSHRRASVPAFLTTVFENSPSSKPTVGRKKSLSANCINDLEKSNNFDMPESGPISINVSKRNSLAWPINKDCDKKYSIYDDRLLTGDDKYSKYGKIYFSLVYNCDAKSLDVCVKKAQHLNGYRFKGKNRFYIKLRLKRRGLRPSESTNTLSGLPAKAALKPVKVSQKKFRTSIQADFCNPNFEETFKFTNVTSTTLNEYELEFLIKEETPKFLEKNRVVGYVDFVLKDALLIEKHECLSEIVREILPMDPNSFPKGLLVLSLQYNEHLSTLSTIIREFQFLPQNVSSELYGISSTSTINVEIYLRSIDNVIHSHKLVITNAENQRYQSDQVIEMQLDPCFLNSVCLVIVIFAKVRQCPKTPYGRVITGPIRFTDGSGLNHWVEMSVGNKEIIRTHKLY